MRRGTAPPTLFRFGLLATSALLASAEWGQSPFVADDASVAESSSGAVEQLDEAGLEKCLFRGRVVMLADALKKHEIRVSEEMQTHVVLQTADGDLIPILADWRGRALYQDKRLRDREVELVAFRRPSIPYLQVLMIFTFDDQGERQYTDYWCDVCSIPMYEIKPCECCQGEIRLRYQPQDLPDYLTSPPEGETKR